MTRKRSFQLRGALGRVLSNLSLRGAYVDYWSCVHWGVGLLFGCGLAQLGMSLTGALAIAAALLLVWEIIEPPLHRVFRHRFRERITNQILDIAIGLAGFLVGFTVISPNELVISLLNILDFIAR